MVIRVFLCGLNGENEAVRKLRHEKIQETYNFSFKKAPKKR